MRFAEKLTNARKANNFSQEQFADMLKVSRQSVSKWENGEAYPNMERLIEMSKILNCTLADLMDDGVLGEEVQTKSSKKEWQAYLKDFLSFISKTYNMFVAMPFWQKIKCLFEMAFLAGVILLIVTLARYLVLEFVLSIFLSIPIIGDNLHALLHKLFLFTFFIVGIITWFYLFKIRYLDYYEIIEDVNAKEKVIEEAIPDRREKKIIIRDPQHTSNKFFEGLGAVIMLFCKFFVICISIPAIIIFASFILISVILLCYISYGSLFFWIAIGFIGLAIISLFFIDLFYHFIFKEKKLLKIPLFLVLILGLVVSGIGFGVGIGIYMSYEKTAVTLKTQTVTLKKGETFSLYNIEIDDNVKYGEIILFSPVVFNYRLENTTNESFDVDGESERIINHKYSTVYYLIEDASFKDQYDFLLSSIKNKQFMDTDGSVTVKMSNKTYKNFMSQ